MPTHIEVPPGQLSEDAVQGLVDEFITREGTDYGAQEHSLDTKRKSVMRQLERNEIAIVFDFESESTTLVSRQELKALGLAAEQSRVQRDDD